MWLVLGRSLAPHQWARSSSLLPGDMLTCWVTAISPREGEGQVSWVSAFSEKQYCFCFESVILTGREDALIGGLALPWERVALGPACALVHPLLRS